MGLVEVRVQAQKPCCERDSGEMALPFDETHGARDPRALAILAKTFYRELRSSGYTERDVMSLASELLGMVTSEVRSAKKPPSV